MKEKLLFIGSCVIVLGILLYGICWIITCEQGKYLLPIYYQIPVLIMVIGCFFTLLGIIKNPVGVKE